MPLYSGDTFDASDGLHQFSVEAKNEHVASFNNSLSFCECMELTSVHVRGEPWYGTGELHRFTTTAKTLDRIIPQTLLLFDRYYFEKHQIVATQTQIFPFCFSNVKGEWNRLSLQFPHCFPVFPLPSVPRAPMFLCVCLWAWSSLPHSPCSRLSPSYSPVCNQPIILASLLTCLSFIH